MSETAKTLVLGWGNPGRLDDGLGPALVSAIEENSPDGVTVDSEYQLQVENAETVSRHERVVFVDADRCGAEPFSLRRIYAGKRQISFSTHSVSPESLLALSRDLFSGEPEAWLLGIRGYEFDDFGEYLSGAARENLGAAVSFVNGALRNDEFQEIRPGRASGAEPRDTGG